MKRKAISTLIAELLLIVMVVTLASTVTLWFYEGITYQGNSLNGLAQNAGNQLQGNVDIAYVRFNPDLLGGNIDIQNPSIINENVVSIRISYQPNATTYVLPCSFAPPSILIGPHETATEVFTCNLNQGMFYKFAVLTAQGDEAVQEFQSP